MIARHWRGIARESDASTYVSHLVQDTFPALKNIPGFLHASVFTRPVAQGVEFLVVTNWESIDAIRAFAGADAEAAVVPALVQSLMLSFDARAAHYTLLQQTSGNSARHFDGV